MNVYVLMIIITVAILCEVNVIKLINKSSMDIFLVGGKLRKKSL